jgi:hypothetical protein
MTGQNEGMTDESRFPKWLVPTVIGAVLLALVLVALFREPLDLDPASPEGVVQQYLQAIADEDYTTAHSHLDMDLRNRCEIDEIGRNVYEPGFTATLGDVTEIDEETVQVDVTIRVSDNPGFFESMGGYTYDPGPFRLINENGVWVVTGDPWPGFTYGCDF